MHENDLQLLNWLSLSEEARRANFGQVLRYFVSPLIPIEAIQSETATIGTQVFQTYSARLAGQQFIFIPGQANVQLGWQAGAAHLAPSEWFAQTKRTLPVDQGLVWATQADVDQYVDQMTSEYRIVNMAPMLVAQTPISSEWVLQGEYETTTGRFNGNQLVGRQFLAEIQNTLFRARREQNSAETLESAHLILQAGGRPDCYQVFEKTNGDESELRQILRRRGFDLVSVDQYEWLKGAGSKTLWLSGNHLPRPTQRQQMPFGLQATAADGYELTQDPLVYKGGACVTGGRYSLEQWLPEAPAYESGIQTAALGNPTLQCYYRPAITVTLD